MEFVIGMAKGRTTFRTTFRTANGRGGAGKRVSSELDVLRLIHATAVLERKGHEVHAYFAILRCSDGNSTRPTVEEWLRKYGAEGVVEIVERQLTEAETAELRGEKIDNAAAQAGRGGNAVAKIAERLAEEALVEHVRLRHPMAVEGLTAGVAPPLGVKWDACYVVV